MLLFAVISKIIIAAYHHECRLPVGYTFRIYISADYHREELMSPGTINVTLHYEFCSQNS